MALKYGKWEDDTARQQQKELEAMNAGLWKPKEGRNRLRFLPPKVGHRSPLVVTQSHYIEIPGQDQGIGFNCPHVMLKPGQPCPACRRANELLETSNAVDRDYAFKLKPKLGVFAYVIDRSNPEFGVQAFRFGKTVYDQLTEIRGDEDSGGDFSDPSENGFDIVIVRKGTGIKTEYTVKATDCCGLGEDSWLDALAELPDLEKQFGSVPTMKQIMEKLGDFDLTGLGGAVGVSDSRALPARSGRRRSVEDDTKDTE